MRLDRNINPNGKGKYALINLRKIATPMDGGEYGTITVPESAVTWGGKDQFFVIKYKDIFAAAALKAYARAVRKEAGSAGLRGSPQKKSLLEYAREIECEAKAAAKWPGRRIPD